MVDRGLSCRVHGVVVVVVVNERIMESRKGNVAIVVVSNLIIMDRVGRV